MSALIRLPRITQAEGYYETFVYTDTIIETVRECHEEFILRMDTFIVGGGTSYGITVYFWAAPNLDYLDLFPSGTRIIFIYWTGEIEIVCHEYNYTRQVEKSVQIWHEGALRYSFDSGWTGGADSVLSLDGDGGFRFSIGGAALGIYCGLSHQSLNVLPSEINYAFYCSAGSYTTIPNDVTGSFTNSTVFTIFRKGYWIFWDVDGVIIDQLKVNFLPSSLYADASLYATDDAVVGATFVAANNLHLTGTGTGSLPPLKSRGFSGFTNSGDGILPLLIGTATSELTILGTGSGVLPNLEGAGHGYAGNAPVGIHIYGNGRLPALTGFAYSLGKPVLVIGWGALPGLVGYGYGTLSYDQTGNGAGILPALHSSAGENLNGYSNNILPKLSGYAWVKTNAGILALGTLQFSSYGGTENWQGYCFYDPIYLSLVSGMRGTWLTNSENRIETYFGLLGSNTRTMTVQRNYDDVSGVLAYVATYYVNGTPDRFDLVTDLLDFVKPSTTSAGLEVDRILAHELTHAVMNDRINTTSWPGWFSEGLCEFIHGAAERVNLHLATESISSLLSALNDNVSGHAQMTSRHYAAGYLAVWKLHSVTTGGIKTLLLDMATGTSLNDTIINNTTFGSVADFLAWMTGGDGTLFVQGLKDSNAFSRADTGAIGGYAVDGGPILDNFSVIPD